MAFEISSFTWVIFVGIIVAFIVMWVLSLRRVVPPKYADVVTRKGSVEIYSVDSSVTKGKEPNTVYYQFPSWIPTLGVVVKRMSLENMEIQILDYKTFARANARFIVDASVYCRINEVLEAAQRFPGNTMDDFKNGIKEIIIAAIRKTTANFSVEDVISKRSEIAEAVLADIKDDMLRWGVEIINVSIVDFRDSSDTTVIHDISAKKEAEINSISRQEIASRKRQAEIAEVEAFQAAETRRIEVNESVGKRAQEKDQIIAIEERTAVEKQMEVKRTNDVLEAEISAQAAVKKAEGDKRVAIEKAMGDKQASIERAEGEKQKFVLTGQGEAAKVEAVGSAEADIIKKKGTSEADVLKAKKFAEAEGLDKYADAQKKQQAYATEIRKIEKDERIGLKLAEALAAAQIKYYGSGKPADFMDLFTPKGGLSAAGSVSTLLDIVRDTDPEAYEVVEKAFFNAKEKVLGTVTKATETITKNDNLPKSGDTPMKTKKSKPIFTSDDEYSPDYKVNSGSDTPGYKSMDEFTGFQ
jgi:flotillin